MAHPTFWTMLRRGVRRRCPVCGTGRVFETFLRLRRTCPDCNWVIDREPGAVTGAMYLIAILTQLFAAALFLVFWLATKWSAGVQIAVAFPVIAAFSLVALPVSKGIWVAVDYYTDVAGGEVSRDDYESTAFRSDDDPAGA